MASPGEPNPEGDAVPNRTGGRRLRGALVLVMGCLAVLSPFFAGTLALLLVGLLLIVCGALEMFETFRASDESRRRSAYLSGALSVLAGILLLSRPELILRGLDWFVAGSFLIDGIGKIVAAHRARVAGRLWGGMLVSGLVNGALAVVLVARWPISGRAVIVILVGMRLLTAGWSMLLGREGPPPPVAEPPPGGLHPDRRLGLPPHEAFGKLAASLEAEDASRGWIDAGWCLTLVIVFFAIHFGRMHVAWSLVGMISPLVAALGDVGTALVLAFGILLPCRLAWRKLTRPLERRGWEYLLTRSDQGHGPGLPGRLSRPWLMARLRFSRRMAQMRHSPRAALSWGLQVGLPLTA